MIQLFVNNKEIPTEVIRFSDGAVSIKIDTKTLRNTYSDEGNYLAFTIEPSVPVSDYMQIIMQAEAIIDASLWKGRYNSNRILNLPYLPYARDDREMQQGMACTLAIFLRTLINDTRFNELHCVDPHNEDAVKRMLLNSPLKFKPMSQLEAFKATIAREKFDFPEDMVVIAPDKGAEKKAASIAEYLGVPLVLCEKQRNPANGWITGYDVITDQDLNRRACLIVDDICDGGKTFELCATSLLELGASEVYLYVTHGIFSKGKQNLLEVINNILTYQYIK